MRDGWTLTVQAHRAFLHWQDKSNTRHMQVPVELQTVRALHNRGLIGPIDKRHTTRSWVLTDKGRSSIEEGTTRDG